VPSAEVLHHKGHATARASAANLAAHHKSTYIYLADRHSGWRHAPLRWAMRGGLAVRSRLMMRGARREVRREMTEERRR
jgi:N-acetylglucosaminyl-diphospho-decaprenol L-rhamnosyltransferase